MDSGDQYLGERYNGTIVFGKVTGYPKDGKVALLLALTQELADYCSTRDPKHIAGVAGKVSALSNLLP